MIPPRLAVSRATPFVLLAAATPPAYWAGLASVGQPADLRAAAFHAAAATALLAAAVGLSRKAWRPPTFVAISLACPCLFALHLVLGLTQGLRRAGEMGPDPLEAANGGAFVGLLVSLVLTLALEARARPGPSSSSAKKAPATGRPA